MSPPWYYGDPRRRRRRFPRLSRQHALLNQAPVLLTHPPLLPADERLHRRIHGRHPSRDLLHSSREHVIPVDPARVQRHGYMSTPSGVNGGDDLLADINRLDNGGDESIWRLHAVEEWRRQLARLDEDGADLRVRLAELGGQRLVQGRYAGLGGGVVRKRGCAKVAQDGGHGHNGAPLAAADHGRQEGLEGVEVRSEVRGEALVDVFKLEVEEPLALNDGCVVDQDGGGTEL